MGILTCVFLSGSAGRRRLLGENNGCGKVRNERGMVEESMDNFLGRDNGRLSNGGCPQRRPRLRQLR
jgi:hypothetical protein